MVVPDSAGLSRLDEGSLCRPPIAIGTFRGRCRVHLAVTVVLAKTLSGREINRLHTLNRSSRRRTTLSD